MRETIFNLLSKDDLFVKLKQESLKPVTNGAAIYARVATDEYNGLKRQIKELEMIAVSVGDRELSIYSEVASGLSKDEAKRKEIYRLIADAEKGVIKRLYVKSRDRIARDFIFTRDIAKKLNYYGVELVEME